jgi:hypothetical protein
MTEDPLNHGRVFDQRDQTQTFSATCCSAKYGPRAAEPVFRKATPGNRGRCAESCFGETFMTRSSALVFALLIFPGQKLADNPPCMEGVAGKHLMLSKVREQRFSLPCCDESAIHDEAVRRNVRR